MYAPINNFECHGNKDEGKRQPAAESDGVLDDFLHLFVPGCCITQRKSNDYRY
jgi:hypothetical protein